MDTLKKNEIIIYGDGKQKSEYIFVDDVSESFMRALYKEENIGNEIIHIGSGQNHSVLEIVEA